jgi:hypothetical protein
VGVYRRSASRRLAVKCIDWLLTLGNKQDSRCHPSSVCPSSPWATPLTRPEQRGSWARLLGAVMDHLDMSHLDVGRPLLLNVVCSTLLPCVTGMPAWCRTATEAVPRSVDCRGLDFATVPVIRATHLGASSLRSAASKPSRVRPRSSGYQGLQCYVKSGGRHLEFSALGRCCQASSGLKQERADCRTGARSKKSSGTVREAPESVLRLRLNRHSQLQPHDGPNRYSRVLVLESGS